MHIDRQAKIAEIVRRVAQKTVAPALEQSLFESGILDSFAITDLVAELESEFAIEIPDCDLDPRKFESIVRIDAYLSTLI